MKLLILLLITSCASYRYDANNPVIRRQLIETVKIGVKCPNGYYYSLKADMCYPQLITTDSRDITRVSRPKAKKALKTARIDCKEVFKRINQCMGGK